MLKNSTGIVLPLIVICWLSYLPVKLPAIVKQYNVSTKIRGNLHRELRLAQSRKLLVFVEPSAQAYLVSWNDPFFRGPFILSKHIPDKNFRVMKAYPDHIPVYFRQDLTLNGLQLESDYKIFDHPAPPNSDVPSMFQLALAGETAAKYADRTLFDIFYADLLKGDAADQLRWVHEQLASPVQGQPYRAHFEKGLLHTTGMLLLPKVASDLHGRDWSKYFDFERFRVELSEAEKSYKQTGPIGSTMRSELQKIRIGVDRDRDGILSDSELTRFLNVHLSVFTQFGT